MLNPRAESNLTIISSRFLDKLAESCYKQGPIYLIFPVSRRRKHTMKPKYTAILPGILALIVGLALGCGGAAVLNRGQEPTSGEVQNAELKVGDKAPEFELYDQTGTKVWLSDFRGQKNIVLAFYPAAWTPV
jgi:hypothetical protein